MSSGLSFKYSISVGECSEVSFKYWPLHCQLFFRCRRVSLSFRCRSIICIPTPDYGAQNWSDYRRIAVAVVSDEDGSVNSWQFYSPSQSIREDPNHVPLPLAKYLFPLSRQADNAGDKSDNTVCTISSSQNSQLLSVFSMKLQRYI